MIDNRLVLFSTSTIQAFSIASGMTNVVNNGVTVGGKSAVTATDATGSNWLLVQDLDQLAQAIPFNELCFYANVTAGTCTGTGSLTITFTISYGTDGSTARSTRVLAPLTIVGTSAVLTPNYGEAVLGWNPSNKYIKVSWVIALTTLTGPSMSMTIGLRNEPDSGIGRVGTSLA